MMVMSGVVMSGDGAWVSSRCEHHHHELVVRPVSNVDGLEAATSTVDEAGGSRPDPARLPHAATGRECWAIVRRSRGARQVRQSRARRARSIHRRDLNVSRYLIVEIYRYLWISRNPGIDKSRYLDIRTSQRRGVGDAAGYLRPLALIRDRSRST